MIIRYNYPYHTHPYLKQFTIIFMQIMFRYTLHIQSGNEEVMRLTRTNPTEWDWLVRSPTECQYVDIYWKINIIQWNIQSFISEMNQQFITRYSHNKNIYYVLIEMLFCDHFVTHLCIQLQSCIVSILLFLVHECPHNLGSQPNNCVITPGRCTGPFVRVGFTLHENRIRRSDWPVLKN